MTTYKLDQDFAQQLDAQDPLASFRAQFHIPQTESGQDIMYFCGHSLGLQPHTTKDHLANILAQWQKRGVEAFFEGEPPWLNYYNPLKQKMIDIVGASPLEITIMNALTVNLHLMLVSFYRPTSERYKILIEANAFPSDLYALKSQIRFQGYDPSTALLVLEPRPDESWIRTEDIEALLDKEGETIALTLLGGVNYLSGQLFDIATISQKAKSMGCMVGFDLAHAAGNVKLNLHDWQVDFAVWCNYKYLNSGPGAIGSCFVHEKHAHNADLPRFAGWWGNSRKTQFLMKPDFEIETGADGWQISSANMFSLAALAASLDIFEAAGMAQLLAKSKKLSGYLAFLLEHTVGEQITILTPPDPDQRGCQLSFSIKKGDKRIFNKLTQQNILCDWREPNVIRIAPVPLYNQFIEVFKFTQILKAELEMRNEK